MSDEGPVREAAWLTTEEAEGRIARHEGWVVSPAFFRRGKLPTAVAAVAAGALVASLVVPGSNPGFALFALAGLSLGSIPLVLHWERRQAAARQADVELREGFGWGKGRFVSLIVRQGEAPTGEDRGMLWFEDGRLYFSGHRTSFGLVPSQVRGYTTLRDEIPRIRNAVTLVLDRDTPVGPTSLSFGLMLPPTADATRRRSELRDDLGDWKSGSMLVPKRFRDPSPTRDDLDDWEDGQWPPSALGPGAASERALLVGAAAWTFLFPTVAAAASSFFCSPVGTLLAFVVACGLFGAATDCAPRWRALRDRRRLRLWLRRRG